MTYINNTGKPSVTQMFRAYINTDFFTDDGRDRGNYIHAAAAAYLLGQFIPSIPDEWSGYFDSFRRWADLMVDEVVFCERRIVDHKLGFCGKPDAVVRLRGRFGLWLVDWKTSAGESKWWRLQTAAYRHLVEHGDADRSEAENGDLGPERIPTAGGAAIRLKADGSTAVLHDYSDTYQRDWNVFLSVRNAYLFFKGEI